MASNIINADKAQATAASGWNKTATKEKTSAEEAQHRFLTLLTTQMRNQDPMNPMENAEVTSQMAQINTVSGITKLQETIEALSKTMTQSVLASQSAQASSLIGRQVLASGNSMLLSNGDAQAVVELPKAVGSATLDVLDGAGIKVLSKELGAKSAGQFTLNWDGKDGYGNPVQDGVYQFRINAFAGDEQVTAKTMTFATVSSVRLGSDGIKLDLGARGSVALADVNQIK